MEERIERTALKHLIHTEQYARKVLPFLKEEYFTRIKGDKSFPKRSLEFLLLKV